MNSRLILVDGFAGSGKSTAAQRLWLYLARAGVDARWWHEHETAHPVFAYGEVDELLALDVEAFETRVEAGWRKTVERGDRHAVRIIEGAFFQLPLAVMVAMNAPAARIRSLLLRLDTILAAAGASLVYLAQPDAAAALSRVARVRGPEWIEGIIRVLAESPYGRRHKVRTVRGLVRYYDHQRALIDSVLPRMAVRRRVIDVSGRRWETRDRQMTAFLGIPPVAAPVSRSADLIRHTGTYRGASSGRPCVVTMDAESLYVQLPSTPLLRLVRVEGPRFCAESLPIDMRFTFDTRGRARRFTYASRMANEVLSDTAWVRT